MSNNRSLFIIGTILLVIFSLASVQGLTPVVVYGNSSTNNVTHGPLIADLVFVLDESGSVSHQEFAIMLNWTNSIIESFKIDIDRGNFLVGVVGFHSSARVLIPLRQYSYYNLTHLVSGIKRSSGGTSIGKAINLATNHILNDGRKNVTREMIVLTDGMSSDSVQQPSDTARNHDIITVSVGVGSNVDHKTLKIIAGDENRVFTTADFDHLSDITRSIQTVITVTVIQSMDYCKLGKHNCHPSATCIINHSVSTGFRCVCQPGFYMHGAVCLETHTVTCMEDSMSLRVLSYYYLDAGIQLEDLHLGAGSCKGKIDPYNRTYWIFDVDSYQSCATKFVTIGSRFRYINTLSNSLLHNQLFPGAARIYTFSCNFDRNLTDISLVNNHYKVIKNVAVIYNPFGKGQFNAYLNIYSNANYYHIQHKKTYHAKDTLYFKISLGTNDTSIDLVLQKCWVTPTPSIHHQYEYVFLDNGCPVRRGSGNLRITRNGRGPVATFESKVFSYLYSDTTYLHCSLHLCSSASSQSCVPFCNPGYVNGRKRRALEEDANSDILSLGPFTVKRDIDQNHLQSRQRDEKSSTSYSSLLTNFVAVVAVIGFLALLITKIRERKQRKSIHVSDNLEKVAANNPSFGIE